MYKPNARVKARSGINAFMSLLFLSLLIDCGFALSPALAQSYDLTFYASGPQGLNSTGTPVQGSAPTGVGQGQSGSLGAANVMSSGGTGQTGSTWNNGPTVKGYKDMNQAQYALTNKQTQSAGGMGALNLNPAGTMGLARVFGYGGGSGGSVSPGGYIGGGSVLGAGAIPPAESFGYANSGGVGTNPSTPVTSNTEANPGF